MIRIIRKLEVAFFFPFSIINLLVVFKNTTNKEKNQSQFFFIELCVYNKHELSKTCM